MDDLVYFYPEGHAVHYEAGHPERPERVEVIRIALEQLGWWDAYPHVAPLTLPDRVLHTVHSPAVSLTCWRSPAGAAGTWTRTRISHKLRGGWHWQRREGGSGRSSGLGWTGQTRLRIDAPARPSCHAWAGHGLLFVE